MLFTSLHSTLFLLCISFFTSITYGAPVQDEENTLNKRAFYAIGSLKSSGPHQRLEIRQLQKNTAQWNLYLLALNKFKAMSQSDKLSYYQIAGIHGAPFVEWDSVSFTPGRGGGYCTHDIVLFPTWHRPYLALYEQVLYNIVQQVAAGMTQQKATYVAAAKTFRAPYWDWAAPRQNGVVYPSFFKGIIVNGASYLDINMPGGTQRIKNPLYSYTFHPLDPKVMPNDPFSTWPSTLRYPTSNAKGAASRNDAVAAQMLQSQASYSQRFMNILQVYWKFEHFGNSGWIPNSPGSYDSLEGIHDQIHGLIGNGGHMGVIDYAAFDPIFWLHHTNVDRLFAIWQEIYPKTWMPTRNKINYGSAILNPGQNVDENTPLKPFHKNPAGDFWTSKNSRYTTEFGYTYPETTNANPSSARRAVNNLYSATSGKHLDTRMVRDKPSTTSDQPSTISDAAQVSQTAFAAAIAAGLDPEVASQIAANATSTTAVAAMASSSSVATGAAEHYKEWITNIRVAKDALDSAFFIHIFLGDFNPDPACWSFEPNLVGTHAVFTPFTNASAALSEVHRNIVTGTIPLTRTLNMQADQGLVDLSDTKCVEEYMKKNLHWRVTRMDDTDVPRSEVPELKISVVSCDVTPAESDDEFPVWGEWSVHTDITAGRPAGLCPEDDS